MEILYWSIIVIFLLMLVIGIKDWIYFFLNSFSSNGFAFTICLIILGVLFIAPSLIKDYAPDYYGLSVWALILYCVGLVAYRNLFRKSNTHSKTEDL